MGMTLDDRFSDSLYYGSRAAVGGVTAFDILEGGSYLSIRRIMRISTTY